jgi:hypothetical protein
MPIKKTVEATVEEPTKATSVTAAQAHSQSIASTLFLQHAPGLGYQPKSFRSSGKALSDTQHRHCAYVRLVLWRKPDLKTRCSRHSPQGRVQLTGAHRLEQHAMAALMRPLDLLG